MKPRFWIPVGVGMCMAFGFVGHAQDTAKLPTEIRLRNLEGQIQAVRQKLTANDGKVLALEKRVKELLEKAFSVQKPPAVAEEKPIEEPKLQPIKVEYRPPLFVLKKGEERPTLYVCKDARVFVLNQSSLRSQLQGKQVNQGDFFQMGTGDFDLVVSEFVFPRIKFEAKLRPNKTGESLERISQADSEFMKHLTPLNKNRDKVIFLVFPDSYEAFRAARALVWRQGMTLEWYPRAAGDAIWL